MKASAIANSNIALVKYWGKRDPALNLPNNSSIGITLSGLFTHTTADFDSRYKEDTLILDGREIPKDSPDYLEYFGAFFSHVRRLYGISLHAKVASRNNFPTGAGLASSASGFAALAVAVNAALSLSLDQKQLSVLARLGSGSASRSVCGGFAEWNMGKKTDGADSYAETIAPAGHWKELCILACITESHEKKIKSRPGMAQTVRTSPFYNSWLSSVNGDLENIRAAILKKDFFLLGKTAEENCLKMHATMITTVPSIIYWNEMTVRLIHAVRSWREQGIPCYFTMDAGPQVKILCMEEHVKPLFSRLKSAGVMNVITSRPGEAAHATDSHLF